MARNLRLTTFRSISVDLPFFDSLKADYAGFEKWFSSKGGEDLYVVEDDHGKISGMLYLKRELGPITDVFPPLRVGEWLKVGTLKIEARQTKLGERIMKKIFDTAISMGVDGIYLTVLEKYDALIELIERYGFSRSGAKSSAAGIELVFARDLKRTTGELVKDYPFILARGKRVWLLAIYPEYHSRLFPDSILRNEPKEMLQDVAHTNTIHKVYIGRVPLSRMSVGDVVVMYRTTDENGRAYYRSVATSICVVGELKRRADFPDLASFVSYAQPHSVFDQTELSALYRENSRLHIARMTYNVSMNKRVNRKILLEDVGISEQPRWDLRELTTGQLNRLLELGQVSDRIVVY